MINGVPYTYGHLFDMYAIGGKEMPQDLKTILEKITYTDDAQVVKQVTEQLQRVKSRMALDRGEILSANPMISKQFYQIALEIKGLLR